MRPYLRFGKTPNHSPLSPVGGGGAGGGPKGEGRVEQLSGVGPQRPQCGVLALTVATLTSEVNQTQQTTLASCLHVTA